MKSIEVKFAEACEALKKANKFDKFRETCPIGSNIEAQLNAAEAVLSGKVEEAERARRTVRKHNGAQDNGHVFTESGWPEYSGAVSGDPREAQVKGYMVTNPELTENECRHILGLAPKEIAVLGRHAVVDYDLARSIGLSEADAIVAVKQSKMGRKAEMYTEATA